MRSVGLDLQAHLGAGTLRLEAARPSLYGFEMHLARVNRDLELFDPEVVAIDPLSAFRGPPSEVHAVLLRLLDLLKSRGITTLFTSLSEVDERSDAIDAGLSSLMDTWISLRNVESDGERNRILYLLKARGMSHSNQLREFRMSESGISVIAAYIGVAGVLTGSSRLAQEAREQADDARRAVEQERRRREIARKRTMVERQVAELLAALEVEEAEAAALDAEEAAMRARREADRAVMASRRGGA
jgi:circadian clock protein KaiC